MKKLILMTSALTLVGSGAFAAAHSAMEMSLSGSVGVTVGNWGYVGDGDPAFARADFNTEVVVGLDGNTGGLNYGGELSLDQDGNSQAVIFFGGDFGLFEFGEDEWDTVGDDEGDIRYSNSLGNVDIEAIINVNGMGAGAGGQGMVGADFDAGNFMFGVDFFSDNSWSVDASTDLGGAEVGGSFDNTNAWDIYVSTQMGGVDMTATYDSSDVAGLELSGSAGVADWSIEGDSTGTGAASVSTTVGGATVSISYDHDGGTAANGGDTGDDARTVLRVEQTVGNVTLHAQVNDAEESEVGASATFSY